MSRGHLFDFISGNLAQRTVASTLVPLIFIFYFGTLICAVWVFPGNYDWRSSVISNLLSPQRNPEFHWFASLGLALTGLLSVPFGGYIAHRLRPASRLGANIGKAAFVGGSVALSLASMIVTRRSHPILGILGVHELLARSSALGLGIAIVCFNWCAWRGSSIDRSLCSRRLAFLWSALTLLTFLALAGCIGSLLIPKSVASGMPLVYQMLRHSPFWHLAFWEWVGSIAVFLFLTSAALFLPKEVSVPIPAGPVNRRGYRLGLVRPKPWRGG